MTNDQLKAMNARCEAATEGPWEIMSDGYTIWGKDNLSYIAQVHPFDPRKTETIQFIAHARTDLPACLKEIERLQEETKSFEYTRQAVSKIWKILGIATYEQAKGKSVDQLVQDKLDETERLRGVLEDIANDEHDVGWYATYAQDESRKALEQA